MDPNTGTWHTVGDNGAEFTNIPQGAIVFNHKQTEALLKYGKVAGRGKALVGGTAMVTASGGLWKPSSSGSGKGGSSVSSSDVQKIADAVEEGAKEGSKEGVENGTPDDIEYMSSEKMTALADAYIQYEKDFAKEQKTLTDNNAVNDKLISYLLDQNFGFTDEELQAIIDKAYERYGDSRNGWIEGTMPYNKHSTNFFAGVSKDPKQMSSKSYVMRMKNINDEWSTVSDGNIERFGFRLSDSAYTKDTIRSIIEKFFEAISTGSAANHFKTPEELKNAIANVLYNPDYLMEALDDKNTRKVRAESRLGFKDLSDAEKEEQYTRWLGKSYDVDNTDLWADVLGEKLDELFSGDWYDTLTTKEYRDYTVTDAISSGVEDLIEIFFDRLERRIDKIDRIVSSSFKDIDKRTSASYDKIDLLTQKLADKQKAADVYKEAADAINLSEDLKKTLREGGLRIEDLKGTMSLDQSGAFTATETTDGFVKFGKPEKDADKESVFKDNVSKYQEYYDKYLDTMDEIEEIQESIAEAFQERFDNIQTDYDNQISLLDHEASVYTTTLDQLEAMGYEAETGLYDVLKGIEQERSDILTKKYDALKKEYDLAMASGEIDYGSEAWYELISAINETEEAMQEVTTKMIEYTNKAQELIWSTFDSRQDSINTLIDQNEFLMDMIDESNVFDKDGKMTPKGFTYVAIGLDSLKKNLKLAKNYGAELARITDQLQGDPNNKKLQEREKEVREKQQQAILSARKTAQAINDIELKSLKNLIDNYNDALSKQKDMRDYQRTLRDKTEDISNIRKQIEAYAGDSSEDAVRKVQELRKKLRDSEEDLEDTQYDRYIDMQKDMLDELYKEYEEAMGRRLDDLSGMMSDVASGLEEKADDISETLHTIAQGVGYIIQYEFDKSKLGDIDLDGFVTPGDARLAMRAGVGLEKLTDEQMLYGDIDGDGVVNSTDARAIMRVATKIDTIEEYLRALGIIGYSGGGLVNKTGLAMLHGTASDPEVVLNPSDSKNLMDLRDAMRAMAHTDMLLPGISPRNSSHGGTSVPSIGEIQINIPIDKVEDYNDFINKMKSDDRFGKMIRAASVDLLNGASAMRMYQI